jgi:hypothetical protein
MWGEGEEVESGQTHSCAIHGADLEPRGVKSADLLFELVHGRKRIVSYVDVSWERECELAMGEEFHGYGTVVEPMKYRFVGVQTFVKGQHSLRGEFIICNRHRYDKKNLVLCKVAAPTGAQNA